MDVMFATEIVSAFAILCLFLYEVVVLGERRMPNPVIFAHWFFTTMCVCVLYAMILMFI